MTLRHLALEGIDGSGKSTVIARVSAELNRRGVEHALLHYTRRTGLAGWLITRLYGRAAGGVTVGLIRRIRWLQALLYALNGRANLRACPAQGIVLSDRSVVCSYASHFGQVPTWFLDAVETSRAPDVVYLLRVSPEIAFERLGRSRPAGYEEDLTSLKLFDWQYTQVLGHRPARLADCDFVEIDANSDLEDVVREVLGCVLESQL